MLSIVAVSLCLREHTRAVESLNQIWLSHSITINCLTQSLVRSHRQADELISVLPVANFHGSGLGKDGNKVHYVEQNHYDPDKKVPLCCQVACVTDYAVALDIYWRCIV